MGVCSPAHSKRCCARSAGSLPRAKKAADPRGSPQTSCRHTRLSLAVGRAALRRIVCLIAVTAAPALGVAATDANVPAAPATQAASASHAAADAGYRHAVVTDLTLPLFGAFTIGYNYRVVDRLEAVAGFWYSKAGRTGSIVGSVPYPGTVESIAGIVGMRYFVWRGLHLEYQLLPGVSRYRGRPPADDVNGFTLFNEFRVGYTIDVFLFGLPIRLNFQFPLGFELASTNKPAGFQAADDQDPWFFIFIPNPYVGVRF